MNTISSALNTLFRDVNGAGSYLLAVAGLGTLTMALLQVIKDTTPVRRWFFISEMNRWFARHAQIVAVKKSKSDVEAAWPEVDRGQAQKDLLTLAADGDRLAFFSLDIEKLCGQWSAAAQIVADYPKRYPDLFRCLTALAAPADQELLLSIVPEVIPAALEAQLPAEHQVTRIGERQKFANARTRVVHQIQRAIDSFQICATYRWQWHLHIASFCVSYALAVVALLLSDISAPGPLLVGAAIAGFLAPVARDLLAAVQALRE